MMLPNISEFVKKYITKRENSFFENDLVSNKEKLTKEIKGKSILVIGGAGTIGYLIQRFHLKQFELLTYHIQNFFLPFLHFL